jgi:hypothetical protein
MFSLQPAICPQTPLNFTNVGANPTSRRSIVRRHFVEWLRWSSKRGRDPERVSLQGKKARFPQPSCLNPPGSMSEPRVRSRLANESSHTRAFRVRSGLLLNCTDTHYCVGKVPSWQRRHHQPRLAATRARVSSFPCVRQSGGRARRSLRQSAGRRRMRRLARSSTKKGPVLTGPFFWRRLEWNHASLIGTPSSNT